MKTHNLVQGSPEWLAYRAQHFNASDAPAMMGCSQYKTRTQLLHELHTGLAPEVNAGTQRRFDDGHRFEALARPLAEAIIGDELYPVVGSLGKFSASFDGLTMLEDTAFEHKTLNDELRACMKDEGNGYGLPLQYQVQMEQQLMVSGAGRVLFMASKWEGDELIERRHCWYASDAKLRASIIAGWTQFSEDLAAYVPVAPVAAAVAAAVESLPAVVVQVQGELVVASNLTEFGALLRAFIKRMPVKPATDQEFADTESACKALKKAEDALEAAETSSLAQLCSVEEMRRMVADLRTLARTTRLASEKLVAAQKDAIRLDIVSRGRAALAAHVDSLNARLGKAYMPVVNADFAGAVKGKRTLASLNDAVDTLLASSKIGASATADRIHANLTTLRELASAHAFLFADAAPIVLKEPDDLRALVKSRISEHQRAEEVRIEADRERIRKEEVARLERERLADEEKAKRQRVADDALLAAPAEPEIVLSPIIQIQPVQLVPLPASRLVDAFKPTPHYTPALRLGAISERLGFAVTADFLRQLGFEPAAKERAAVLYHEHDFQLVGAALVAHIEKVMARQRLVA